MLTAEIALAIAICGPSYSHVRPVSYLFGPNTVTVCAKALENYCYSPGMLSDQNKVIDDPSTIGACYDSETETVWLKDTRPNAITHELCHYRCDKARKKDKTFNKRQCDIECSKVR